MTDMRDQIITILRQSEVSMTCQEIAAQIPGPKTRIHREDVQAELHRLDDANRVTMRNGFYRLTQSEKANAK